MTLLSSGYICHIPNAMCVCVHVAGPNQPHCVVFWCTSDHSIPRLHGDHVLFLSISLTEKQKVLITPGTHSTPPLTGKHDEARFTSKNITPLTRPLTPCSHYPMPSLSSHTTPWSGTDYQTQKEFLLQISVKYKII